MSKRQKNCALDNQLLARNSRFLKITWVRNFSSEKGERLKRIGTEARTELERLTGHKVFLEIWVKVRSGWADDDARLRTYGYE